MLTSNTLGRCVLSSLFSLPFEPDGLARSMDFEGVPMIIRILFSVALAFTFCRPGDRRRGCQHVTVAQCRPPGRHLDWIGSGCVARDGVRHLEQTDSVRSVDREALHGSHVAEPAR